MKLVKIFTFILLLSTVSHATTLKDTVLVSNAGGVICKAYAEEVGGDAETFSNMNVQVMIIAEKMGYSSNLQSYQAEVYKVKKVLQDKLLKQHGSKLNVYNDWCIKLYNGYQRGLSQAYQQ